MPTRRTIFNGEGWIERSQKALEPLYKKYSQSEFLTGAAQQNAYSVTANVFLNNFPNIFLNVNVQDFYGNPITGLRKKDFIVEEQPNVEPMMKVEKITSFSEREANSSISFQ
jgi:hypothetical protein